MHRFCAVALTLSATSCVGNAGAPQAPREGLPAWTEGAVCYEVFLRSFRDSDGDGIGDLNGLIEKLDYINDGSPATQHDLGASCIWLMPVAESPSYHGYDVVDYYRVDPEYGSNDDFRRLIAQAHRRGIRVLVDMVLNHASSEHPHFRAALADPASAYRAWFRFLPEHPGVKNPWGGDNWHRSPVRDEYYYAFFWHGMPDFDLEHPEVREEAKRIATFWLREMRVDGFRLDAVKFFIEDGERIQDTPATHAFLREYAAHVRRTAADALTVGEVWDSTSVLLQYYPDQLDVYFAFELADSILAGVRNGSAHGLLAHALRLQREVPAHRYATFLRNHDQPRTMSVLEGDGAGAALAAALLLTLPGIPFLYYGEEIGMTGDKPDERIRTPMQWSAGPGVGFTSGVPWQSPQADSARTHVAAQDGVESSLLELHRRLIHLRAAKAALATGELIPLEHGDAAVAAYLRRAGDHAVLVVVNLGATPHAIALTSYAGVLAPGRYTASSLLHDRAADSIDVDAGGTLRGFAPFAQIGARSFAVLELTPTMGATQTSTTPREPS